MKKKIVQFLLLALVVVLTSCGSSSGGGGDSSGGGGGDSGGGGGDSGGGGGDNGDDNGSEEGDGKSFSGSGNPITIDDIVNGSGAGASISPKTEKVATSSGAAFYFGRFIYVDWSSYILYTGTVKFKLNKVDDLSAYFSNFTLEHYSRVTGYDAHNDIVTSSTDLQVSDSYDASDNHIEIANAASRFVGFDINFGNNDYFGDVTSAGVIFSSDFSTMAGGDDANFFFIAQKVDSQPDVSLGAITGNWNTLNFTVNNNTGNITAQSTSTISVGGTGGNGFTAFTGTTTGIGNIDGELSLTDAISGAFIFGFGVGDGSVTAQEVSGGFLVSADQSLAIGISVYEGLYFAAER